MTRVLVVDTGSTTVRAALVEDGTVTAARTVRHEIIEPPEAFAGKEWDPDRLWADTCGVMRAVSAIAPPDVVVSTTQRLAVVFLDATGRALYAGPNSDARGLLEAIELMRTHEPKMSAVTGHRPPIVLVPARVAWMRRHRPDVADGIRTVLSVADWYAFRLTGEIAAEHTLAGDTGLLDVSSGRWAPEVSAWGVDPGWLPPLSSQGYMLGTVTAEAAEDTGVPRGTPVAVGCADTMAALLGMGVVEPGAIGAVAGSTLPVMQVHSSPPQDDSGRCWRGCHAPRDLYLLEVNGGEAGIAQEWLASLLGVVPEELHEIAAQRPPAELPPALLGPAPMDFSDMPVSLQGWIRFPLPVGMLGPDKATIGRAFVENLAYAVCRARDWLGAGDVETLDLGGGLSESALFPRILAAALAIPVRCHGIGVTTRGAALCATVALGEVASLTDGAKAGAVPAATIEPDPDWTGTYAAGYRDWAEAHDRALAEAVRISAMM